MLGENFDLMHSKLTRWDSVTSYVPKDFKKDAVIYLTHDATKLLMFCKKVASQTSNEKFNVLTRKIASPIKKWTDES